MEESPWTAGELAALEAARFRPGAWRTFLARSFARAAEARAERSRARRQVRVLGATAAATSVALATAWSPVVGAVFAAWWALGLVMLGWHLALLDGAKRRLEGLGPANLISIARLSAVPLLPFLPPVGVVVALGAAGASDVLDGALARRRGETTRLGAWLDRTSDSLVAAAAVVAALRLGAVGGAVAGLALARVLAPWPAAFALTFARARVHAGPLPFGRATGAGLVASLAAAVLGAPHADALVAAVAATGIAAAAAPTVLNRIRLRPHRT